jgi:opacity protein-like surface antigen
LALVSFAAMDLSRTLLIALIPAFLAAPAAFGQAEVGSVEIGVGEGRFYGGSFAKGSTAIFDRKTVVDDDVLKAFWLGAQVSRNWGLEVAVRRTPTHVLEPRGGLFPDEPAAAGLDFATIELSGLRSFRLGRFLPYAGFGAGIANLDIDAPEESVRDSNRLCLSASAGARYFAWRWIGFRIDVRARATYLGRRSRGEDQGWTDAARWFKNAEVLGGVFFSFGGR